MEKYCRIFLVICVLGLVSCRENYKVKTVNLNGVKETFLQSEEVKLSESPLFPKGCCIRDSFLIVFEPKLSDGFLLIYNEHTGELIKRYGTRGEGPSDFINPRFIFNANLLSSLEYLLIGDVDALYLLDVDSIVSTNQYIHSLYFSLPEEVSLYNYVLAISDTCLIVNQTCDAQLTYYNLKSKHVNKRNFFEKRANMRDVSDFCYATQICDAYYTSSQNSIIIAYKNKKQIDIISMSGELMKSIYFDNYLYNDDKMILKNKNNVKFDADAIMYFSYVLPMEKYFYALCWDDTRENMKNGRTKSKIYKFDWDGNLIEILNLDRAISCFCIYENEKIYAIGLSSDDLDLKMYCYQIYHMR